MNKPSDRSTKSSNLKNLRRIIWGVVVGWTLLLIGLFILEMMDSRGHARDMMRTDAHANFNKDQAFRHWASSHGGVYVPVTETTQPNQFLTKVAERDIETPSGKKLTLMNPAYMVRQFNESFKKDYGIVGNITSLKLLNPDNKPDEWETKALNAFEKGTKEVFEFTETDESSYLRLMRPMFINKSCLKCHSHQGYKEGDVRGGVGVTISTEPYFAKAGVEIMQHGAVLILLWLLGLVGIWFGNNKIRTRIMERDFAMGQMTKLYAELEDKVIQRTAQLEATNKELKAFSYSVSHDLRGPLTRMSGFSKALQENYADKLDEKGVHYLNRISASGKNMAGLIDDLLALSKISQRKTEEETVNLSDTAENILKKLQETDKDRTVEIIIHEGMKVKGDAGLMKILMENLLDNAWKYTGKEKHAKIEFGKTELEDKSWFYVKDNGIGFDMEYYDNLFLPFQRLHSNGEFDGNGIGLATVQRVINRYSGKIKAESEPEKGATFYFTL